jgi:hypothetical protein
VERHVTDQYSARDGTGGRMSRHPPSLRLVLISLKFFGAGTLIYMCSQLILSFNLGLCQLTGLSLAIH